MPRTNREAVRLVRERIESEPPERFEYANVYTDLENKRLLLERGAPEHVAIDNASIKTIGLDIIQAEHDCNTAACVAGWAVLVHKPPILGTTTAAAMNVLGLDSVTSNRLFYVACGTATRKDAIKRLKWLEQHGDLDEYPFEKEQGYDKDEEYSG